MTARSPKRKRPVLDAPADTAEALAAAAPALAEADERWTREHADRGGDGTASKVGQREDAPDALDFVAERPRSLAVHVLEQIELMFSDAAERRIALKLAEGLDEAGYCRLEAPRGGRGGGRQPRNGRGACGRACARSSRPACSRARSPNAWAPSSPSAIASTRR